MKTEIWQEPPIPTTDEPSFQNVQAFASELRCDISNPAYFPPITPHQKEKEWARNMEITGRSLGMLTENRELGERYSLELAGVGYVIKSSVNLMHESSPIELQKNHPRATFSFRHPSPHISKLEIGLPITSEQKNAEDELRIDLPITAEPNNTEIEWFNSLTYFQAKALSNMGDSRVYSLPKLINDAGLNVRTHSNRRIARLLREKGIYVKRLTSPEKQKQKGRFYPVRRIFVLGDHYTRAVEALKNDPDFKEFRMRKNGGDK